MKNELEEYRSALDRIDAELVRLFIQRMNTVTDINAYKAARKLPVRDTGREAALLERIAELTDGRYTDETLELFGEILRVSREYQERRRDPADITS